MADSKIGVGATIGIVVGITAVLGLGLYLILRPKTSSAATIPVPTTSAEVESLKAQLALLKQQQASNPSLSQQQKDANDAQIQAIGIALGGKVLTAGVDKLIDIWTKPKLDTTPIKTYYPSTDIYDLKTPTYLSPTLPAWAQNYGSDIA